MSESESQNIQADTDGVVTVTISGAFPKITLKRVVTTLRNVSSLLFLDYLSIPAGHHNVTWSLHTKAQVTVSSDKQSALLHGLSAKDSVTVSILTESHGANCADTSILALKVDLAPPQYSSKGFTEVVVVSPSPTKCSILGVMVGDPLDSFKDLDEIVANSKRKLKLGQ